MLKKLGPIVPIFVVAALALAIFFRSQGTGSIKIDAAGFETDLNLRGPGGTKNISTSNSVPVDIRAGTYKPERIVVRLTKTSEQWWSILCRREPWGKLAIINVAKGNTTTLKLGPPLEIRTDVQHRNRTASIGLALIGQAGEHYSPEVLTHNGPLPAPGFTIVDESGQELATGKFEYG